LLVIVDYGLGNIGSIRNMFKRIGVECAVSGSVEDIIRADRLVLPGVGAFDQGMQNLAQRQLVPALTRKVVDERAPVLGICLGMQLLVEASEEGACAGLGWIKGRCRRFAPGVTAPQIKVPHMGWNTVRALHPGGVFAGLEEESRFYFVHSYYVACDDPASVLGVTSYGTEFPSAIMNGNILGVQFHPEKSHKFGMRLLENFARHLH